MARRPRYYKANSLIESTPLSRARTVIALLSTWGPFSNSRFEIARFAKFGRDSAVINSDLAGLPWPRFETGAAERALNLSTRHFYFHSHTHTHILSTL
jgi:hypothetical protein